VLQQHLHYPIYGLAQLPVIKSTRAAYFATLLILLIHHLHYRLHHRRLLATTLLAEGGLTAPLLE